jgi:hypothetical protein
MGRLGSESQQNSRKMDGTSAMHSLPCKRRLTAKKDKKFLFKMTTSLCLLMYSPLMGCELLQKCFTNKFFIIDL